MQSPYEYDSSSSNLTGYSLGMGINFGFTKLDFAYEESNQSSSYNFYSQYDNIEPTYLKKNNSIFTATLVFSI